MEVSFYKIHIFQNDLIVANYLNSGIPDPENISHVSRKILRKHVGVGGNGVIFLLPGEEEKLKIRFYLSNGKESAVIHDALLCVSRFAFDFGLATDRQLRIETENTIHCIDIIDSKNFRIDLGIPLHTDTGKELIEIPDQDYNKRIKIADKVHVVTPVSLSLNGIVAFPSNMDASSIKQFSRQLNKSLKKEWSFQPVFPVMFSREEMTVYAWFSRLPVDFSSVAGIATVASVINGFAERDPLVHINQNDLFVQWNDRNNHVYCTGRPEYVFSGTYYADV